MPSVFQITLQCNVHVDAFTAVRPPSTGNVTPKKTLEVDNFIDNSFGISGMTRNVWEWVKDNWHPSYKNSPLDGQPWLDMDSTIRVTRSGAFNSIPKLLTSTSRSYQEQSSGSDTIGFRIAVKDTKSFS